MSGAEMLDVPLDFDFVLTFLPEGWEEKAKELGALRRCRKIGNATVLLRLLLIHLAEGYSLRETAVRAKHGGLVDVSDVAIMDRLRGAGEWFRWMNRGLMSQWVLRQPESVYDGPWNVRVIDGTHVKEPGPTGSSWRIHYSVGLPSLGCSELHLTPSDGVGNGETFQRFKVQPGDLFIGDRGYGVATGIAHVTNGGGNVLTRFCWQNLPLWVGRESKFDLLARLRGLRGSKLGDWPVFVKHGKRQIAGRVCAVKKSRQLAEEARRQARRKAQKNGVEVMPKTVEAAGYFFVFTTVSAEALNPSNVLEFYRGRWQVELVFKRLKSILGLGHLHKTDEESARSWIHGKLFVAFLLEALLRYGETFFPWGYPLCPDPEA